MNRTFILDLGLFEPRCGSIEWSEKIIRPLLEMLAYANGEVLKCGIIPPLYQSGVRYGLEPPDKEIFSAIPKVLAQGWGDCFPMGTLVLDRRMNLVPIESLTRGDEIWGLEQFSRVEALAFKGELFVDAIRMNNGSTMCLTSDHHVYVRTCEKHGPKCESECSDRSLDRVRVSELKPKMILAQPDRLEFGSVKEDPERMYVEGLFISDGWTEASRPNRFSISGHDGKPKEIQKREVQTIAERLGLKTSWHQRYLRVYDRAWANRMREMGTHAQHKHALSLDLEESGAASLLRGIMADACVKNTRGYGRTFTTTSKILATQVRVLNRMFGRSTGYSYIEAHGGLGQHPIYRINVRAPHRRHDKLLRVSSIARNIARVPCYDLQTSDHRVYLPEHDVTVSQCDDLAGWRVAELRHHGEPAQFRILKFVPPNGKLTYHIQVQRMQRGPLGIWIKGAVEDPSAILGMKGGV